MFPNYIIDGITYEQHPLVIGQVEQLIDALSGISFPASAGVMEIIQAIGRERLMRACAVVLRPQGKARWWDRDVDAMAEAFLWSMDAETAIRIVTDFFACNPLSSLFEALSRMNEAVRAVTAALMPSPASSSSLPEETSREGSASDGATP